jgi:outer membrane protein OmpA-like peptidoglycan-associated protein
MRQSIALAALASCTLAATAQAIAADPRFDKHKAPPAPRTYDPFIIFFDSGSAALTPMASQLLDNVATAHSSSPHCRLDVASHADRAGSATFNLALSKRRAEAIRAYLRLRVRAEIRIEHFGESRMLIETHDGVAEPKNRFATIMFECPDGHSRSGKPPATPHSAGTEFRFALQTLEQRRVVRVLMA